MSYSRMLLPHLGPSQVQQSPLPDNIPTMYLKHSKRDIWRKPGFTRIILRQIPEPNLIEGASGEAHMQGTPKAITTESNVRPHEYIEPGASSLAFILIRCERSTCSAFPLRYTLATYCTSPLPLFLYPRPTRGPNSQTVFIGQHGFLHKTKKHGHVQRI